MLGKGKGPKVLIAAGNSGSRLLTFPRGDTQVCVRHKARKGGLLERQSGLHSLQDGFGVFDVSVFVLDRHGKAVMPCTEKRARLLLDRGRARVHRVLPMVIRLIDVHADSCEIQPLSLKLDPGSKTTGVALVRESDTGTVVANLMEIVHRGRQISEALTARRSMRRRRRGANLRHRAPRFNNRTKPTGWLAPSLQHRVDTTMAWVNRICCWAPVTRIAQELVRFDMQLLQNPEISGVQYQQGELAGYELREYLLEKWKRTCAYCDATNTPLEIEHIKPKATGGSDRASNLTLACHCCNQKKAALPVEVFLAKDLKRLARILATAKAPLKDAAAVNSTLVAEAALGLGRLPVPPGMRFVVGIAIAIGVGVMVAVAIYCGIVALAEEHQARFVREVCDPQGGITIVYAKAYPGETCGSAGD